MSKLPPPEVPGFVLHPVSPADAAEWAEFAALPQVQQHTSSAISRAADLLPMIERSQSEDESAPVLFVVRQAATHQLVATVGFHTISSLNRTAEITYVVRPEHWGQGLATRLCDAAVQWGFDARGWVRVQATVLEANRPSIRVLQKCRFAYEGRLRNFRLVRGKPSDYLLYARVPEAAP
ncbi:MAG: GNAT family N-acetyltransferase [Aquincola sp.]|nr:GNAT family N-acetyltransferase [Aquincola sp.]